MRDGTVSRLENVRAQMKILKLAAIALLLSACSSNNSVPSTSGGGGRTQPGSKAFTYTGKEQSFSVPAHVTKIKIVALGAVGGGHNGGRGGRTTATISVTPGQTLAVFVGGEGSGCAPVLTAAVVASPAVIVAAPVSVAVARPTCAREAMR